MVMLSMEAGSNQRMNALLNNNGEISVIVNAGTTTALPNRGGGVSGATTLTFDDVAMLKDQFSQISVAVPTYERAARLEYLSNNVMATVTGSTPPFLRMRNYQIAEGRLLDEMDEANAARVVVLGQTVIDKLFANQQCRGHLVNCIVGSNIEIGDHPYTVVGLLKRRGTSGEGLDLDDVTLIPLKTAMRRLDNVDHLTRVFLLVPVEHASDRLSNAMQRMLDTNHRIRETAQRDFSIVSPLQVRDFNDRSGGMMGGLFKTAFSITALVAALGIVSVTLLNIKDRLSEIGLRKAMGARWQSILAMILAEAVLLAIVGAIGGVIFGYLLVNGLQLFSQWQMAIDMTALVTPLFVAVLITLLVSLGPAIYACQLNIVEALAK